MVGGRPVGGLGLGEDVQDLHLELKGGGGGQLIDAFGVSQLRLVHDDGPLQGGRMGEAQEGDEGAGGREDGETGRVGWLVG